MTTFFRFPRSARLLYREAIFRLPEAGKKVCLTFDDGPTASGTAAILKILKQNEVNKAVFFCNGSNILDYPGEITRIRDNGYSVANHGFFHLDAWKSRQEDYVNNCLKGQEISESTFFRPPYGHLGIAQYRSIKRNMRIVFWDMLLYDFEPRMESEYILRKAEKLIRPGSVIVLHDKENKCALRILGALINICRSKGYTFGDLSEEE